MTQAAVTDRRGWAGLTGVGRVWVLTAAVAPLAALVAFLAWRLSPPPSPVSMPGILFVPLFYVAEITIVHLRLRRDAHSFSMSEVPLVMGLFLLAPSELLLAQFLGSALALGVSRRQQPVKLAFNLTQLTLQGGLAAVTFHTVVDGSDLLGGRGWLGVLAAVAATLVVSNVLIGAAIALAGGPIGRAERLSMLRLTSGAGVMNAALGLVAVTIVWASPRSAWTALIPPLVLYFAYRAYLSQRQERDRLQALYEASRELHRLPRIDEAIAAAVDRARTIFDAETAEAVVYPDGPRRPGYRTHAAQDHDPIVMEPTGSLDPSSRSTLVMSSGAPSLLFEKGRRRRRSASGMAAPIAGPSGVVGVLTVSAPMGDIGGFTQPDLKLLEALAGHIGVSIENGRLEDSLAKLTELKDELRHQALHDGLTGLANRTVLTDRLAEIAGEGAADRSAVLFLDLDDFKTVNDTFGHDVGDQLLVEVAHRLRACCRPSDTVARIGGDEFALLLESLPSEVEALTIAGRVVDALDRPFLVDERAVETRASVGVAMVTPEDDPLRCADDAMYAAKRDGKGTFRVFTHDLARRSDGDPGLAADLRRAVRDAALALHLQPIIELSSGTVAALEGLVRWPHPERGLLYPAAFLPVAERRGFIHEIGAWVLQSTCEAAAGWRVAGAPPMVAVNVSGPELSRPGMVEGVLGACDELGLDPALLMVEITEGAVVTTAHGPLHELRDRGVRIALDDFGTGYSSLAYLDRLPVDVVKIDRSFVARVDDPKVAKLVEMMVEVCSALGLVAVAEGVESAAQLETVLDLGFRYGQGFHLGRPLEAGAVGDLLSAVGVAEDRLRRPVPT